MTDFNTGGPGAGAGASGPSGPRADFGIRLVAYIIDVVVFWVIAIILTLLLKTVGYLLSLVIFFGYFTYVEGSPSGQTIGKKVMNIKVVLASSGGEVGVGVAMLRNLGRYVSGFVCLLGYFWMLWDDERQTWHDKISSTYVVPA